MTGFQRFAIYAAPPPGPLAGFAAAWLGWDAAAGRHVDHPALPGLPRPVAEITAEPRKYGFHATLKPPFRLAPSSSLGALEAECKDLARGLAPVALEGLSLSRLGRFLALVPDGETGQIDQLAHGVLRGLDRHRAPLTECERARYAKAVRTPAQAENLALWGYPWVRESFRFHFTLTSRLPKPELETVRAALAPRILPLLKRPFPIDALYLFAEDAGGRFHALARYPLAG